MKKFMKGIVAFLAMVGLGALCVLGFIVNLNCVIANLIKAAFNWVGDKYLDKMYPIYKTRSGYKRFVNIIKESFD
ncbi:MAG: hypothetical protein IKU29_05065 [Parabacteroides sp.]|nr:hypothetical protein [Parabacteroides sp.]